MRFLESEGELRELINDMRINQPGTARIEEGARWKLKRKKEGDESGQTGGK